MPREQTPLRQNHERHVLSCHRLAEDMADIRAAEAARAEMKATGEQPIPWAEVKADLGLV
jgi:hypothetical protein